jgi:hypothetical protein
VIAAKAATLPGKRTSGGAGFSEICGIIFFGKRSFFDGFTKMLKVPGSPTEVANPH